MAKYTSRYREVLSFHPQHVASNHNAFQSHFSAYYSHFSYRHPGLEEGVDEPAVILNKGELRLISTFIRVLLNRRSNKKPRGNTGP